MSNGSTEKLLSLEELMILWWRVATNDWTPPPPVKREPKYAKEYLPKVIDLKSMDED